MTELTKKPRGVLVIGGGIAGVQAALDLADAGIQVHLVEKSPSIGGVMAQLDKTFPTNDCAMCILSPKVVAAARHPNIQLLTYSEVTKVEGKEGDFEVTVLRHPRYVDESKCVACGACAQKCPSKVPNEFDKGMSTRKAIYIPFPQAVPLKYTIDAQNCVYLKKGKCQACLKACQSGAVDFEQKPEEVKLSVGSIIVATGAEQRPPAGRREYGYGIYRDVLTSIEFERLLNAVGPTGGKVLRRSDGKPPKKLAIIQCAGSRDEKSGQKYCSRVCCMYSLKQAMLAKEHEPGIEKIDIVYMDMRAFGKGFEDYYRRCRDYASFRRGKVAEITGEDGKDGGETLHVTFEDLNTGEIETIDADMVILASPIIPSPSNTTLAEALGIRLDENGFFMEENHSPFSSTRKGIYLCGTSSSPKDIPDTVAQASGAAAAAFSHVTAKVEEKKLDVKPLDVSGVPRIGVFVCNCGINIGGVVNVPSIAKYAATLPHVVHSEENLFTCSETSQRKIQETIIKNNINRVIVAACSPRTHEPIFRDSCARVGLNQYLFEMVNIRDQCSWVHSHEPEKATEKAKDLIRMAVAKSASLEPLVQSEVNVTKAALIIGGGIAGIQAAAALASQSIMVYLVEKEEMPGGRASSLHSVYPDDVEGRELVRRKLDALRNKPNVVVLTSTEVIDITGFVGNFQVKLLSKNDGKETAVNVGAIVLALGAQLYKPSEKDYGYGKYAKVITNAELEERLGMASGRGELEIGGKAVKNAVFIQCVGARVEGDRLLSNCSRYCCNAAIGEAIRLRSLGVDVSVLYRDIMAYGKGMEEMYRKASESGVRFINYSGSKPSFDGENVTVFDSFSGSGVSVPADAVVLSVGMVPRAEEFEKVQKMLKVPLGQDGFFMERHAKLGPLDTNTDGIFLAGCCQAPKDIGETVSQASGVAARVMTILSHDKIKLEPQIAVVDESKCRGCGTCAEVCRFNAASIVTESGKKFSRINAALCKGCGACAASCPTGAVTAKGFTHKQVIDMINAFCETGKKEANEGQA